MGDVVVLGIETATDVCAVAVLRGDAQLFSGTVAVPRSHATRLAPLVAEALRHARITPADLALVAVSAGPGSFTGLRIGASLARGLCLATGAHLVGVGTLDALAAEAQVLVRDGETLVVALPSRRGEVYAAVHAGSAGAGEARAVALSTLAAWLGGVSGPVAVAGPAAGAVADVLAAAGRSVRVLDVRPSAERVARLGAALHAAGAGAPPEAFEPNYLGTFATPPEPAAPRGA